jgi:hypothetical protein
MAWHCCGARTGVWEYGRQDYEVKRCWRDSKGVWKCVNEMSREVLLVDRLAMRDVNRSEADMW